MGEGRQSYSVYSDFWSRQATQHDNPSKTQLRRTLRLPTCLLVATLETSKGLEIQINRQIATKSH